MTEKIMKPYRAEFTVGGRRQIVHASSPEAAALKAAADVGAIGEAVEVYYLPTMITVVGLYQGTFEITVEKKPGWKHTFGD